jgi:hypothetical protein
MTMLTHVQPALAAAEERLRAAATAHGLAYKLADWGGLRTEADTAQLMRYRDADYAVYVKRTRAAGKTPVDIRTFRPINAYGTSFHNFGAAFDVEMVKGTEAQLGALAPAAGLRWGGKFPRPDGPHFELPISILEAKAAWLKLGNAPGKWTAAVQAGAATTLLVVGGLALALFGRWKA